MPTVSTTPFLTVAIFVFELDHVTPLVLDFKSIDFCHGRFTLLLDIFTDEPDFTVILQVAECEPLFAVIVAEPAFLAVTIPRESTVATPVFELDHETLPDAVAVIANLLPVKIDLLDTESLTDEPVDGFAVVG